MKMKLADVVFSLDEEKDWKIKRVIAKMYFKGMSYHEISFDTGFSIDYVRKNLVPTLESKGVVHKKYVSNNKVVVVTNDEVEL